ncbi:MAG: iron-containing alcohol dehydrogenase [Treponema sp.]|jgi:alcohol dehydrogenase class IV|nr:iron-containing alcohol dehydrogenase [Treponema sp.]
MISSLLSTVHLLQMDDIKASELLKILRYLSGSPRNPKIALVCDNAPIPKRDHLISELEQLAAIEIFNQVQPNPHTTDIQTMFTDKRFKDIDVVFAIGGGSVMDSAKALAMLAGNGGDIEGYLGNSPRYKIEKKGLPLLLIPTTAGTGSEVTKVGVYSSAKGRKFTLGSPLMQADAALLCGSFIDSIPPSLCASTGLDALDHALESIWNKNSTPITRTAAIDAAIAVLETLPELYAAITENKKDRRPLQKKMLAASCMAGIAFSITGTASGHALSFVLSEDYHIPHGTACAFTLPEIYNWSIRNKDTVHCLAQIQKHFTPEINTERELTERLFHTITDLIHNMNIPQKFSDLNIQMTEEALDKNFSRAFSDPKMHNQLPPLDTTSLHQILKEKL